MAVLGREYGGNVDIPEPFWPDLGVFVKISGVMSWGKRRFVLWAVVTMPHDCRMLREMALAENEDNSSTPTSRVQPRIAAVMEELMAAPLLPGLYLVATPIGHLGDVSLRGLSTLARASFVAAEDTRHSRKLLQHYGIGAEMISYHDHNGDQMRPKIISMIKNGAAVALISDAGTPLVSDPGFKLARMVRAAGQRVEVVPGASAVMAGLSLSGLPTDRFLFEGFLPAKQAARRKRLEVLADVPASLVMFETVKRIGAVVDDALAVLGDRPAALLRELTKLHEEVIDGRLSEIAAALAGRELKGELVLVIGPPEAREVSDEMIEAALREAMGEGASARDSVKQVASALDQPKGRVYEISIAIKNQG